MEKINQLPAKGDTITIESSPGSGSMVTYTFDGNVWTFIDTGGRRQKEVLKRSIAITEIFCSQ